MDTDFGGQGNLMAKEFHGCTTFQTLCIGIHTQSTADGRV